MSKRSVAREQKITAFNNFYKGLKKVIIEKDIAVPVRYRGGVNQRLAQRMEEGDSVHFPTASMAQALAMALMRLGFRGVQRKDDHGYRVWKVEASTDNLRSTTKKI